jgi:hypothetical protein
MVRQRLWLVARTVMVALVALVGRTASAQPAPGGPAPGLIGAWESEAPNNNYIIRVAWNGSSGRYEGALLRQGYISAQAGFVLGEICWLATPLPGRPYLDGAELWRYAVPGQPPRPQWRRGGIRFDPRYPQVMVSGSTRLHRVSFAPPPSAAAPPAAPPPPAPSGPPEAAAPTTAATQPKEQPPGPSDWINELPTRHAVTTTFNADRVPNRLARGLAAFGVLKHYIFVRWGRIPEAGQAPWQRWQEYGGGTEVWPLLSSVPAGELVDDQNFRVEVLSRLLPAASVNAYRSSPGFRATLVRAAERDAELQRQQIEREAEARRRDEQDAEALRRLPKVFGLPLGGKLVKVMPNCGNEKAQPCFEEPRGNGSFGDLLIGLATAGAGAWQPSLLGGSVKIVGIAIPDWVSPLAPMIGQVWNDNLVAIQVRASGLHSDFRDDLIEKFGPPTRADKVSFRNTYGKVWSAPELEWKLKNGLHVQFVPDSKQDDERGWGVLLIETEVAYKARREAETKQRESRTKL